MEGTQEPEASARTVSTRRVDPLIGTLLADRYRILEVLGKGGMGVVYKARHELIGRTVAIKMLLPTLVYDEVQVARFQREATAASRMNHAHVIALHDFGLTPEGLPYIVMDYLQGRSLSEAIKSSGQLDAATTVQIFVQICQALDHAHKLGIIHRDLKPGNIMLINNEHDNNFVKVVDFGIAKLTTAADEDSQRLTSTGEVFGSPVYMSPEQCSGAELDPRSDVYSLGCMLYESLTGKLPFIGRTAIETITRQLQSDPPPFSQARTDLYIPGWLEQITMTTMQKDPSARFQSMQELQEALISGASQFRGPTSTNSGLPPATNSGKSRIAESLKVSAVKSPGIFASNQAKTITIAIIALAIGLSFGAAFVFFGHKSDDKPAPVPACSGNTNNATKTTAPAVKSAKDPVTKVNTTTTVKSTAKSAAEPAAVPAATTAPPTTPAAKLPAELTANKVIKQVRKQVSEPTSRQASKSRSKATSQETGTTATTTPPATTKTMPTTTPGRHKLSGDQWLYQQRVNNEHYGDATPLPVDNQ